MMNSQVRIILPCQDIPFSIHFFLFHFVLICLMCSVLMEEYHQGREYPNCAWQAHACIVMGVWVTLETISQPQIQHIISSAHPTVGSATLELMLPWPDSIVCILIGIGQVLHSQYLYHLIFLIFVLCDVNETALGSTEKDGFWCNFET